MILKILFCISLIFLVSCNTIKNTETYYLPHRSEYEMFPQAISPPPECPNQYTEYVIDDDTGNIFFLSCWGKNELN